MDILRGGASCCCSCWASGSGGSSTSDNNAANTASGLSSTYECASDSGSSTPTEGWCTIANCVNNWDKSCHGK